MMNLRRYDAPWDGNNHCCDRCDNYTDTFYLLVFGTDPFAFDGVSFGGKDTNVFYKDEHGTNFMLTALHLCPKCMFEWVDKTRSWLVEDRENDNKKAIIALFNELLSKYENAQRTVEDEYGSHTEVELEHRIEGWKRRISGVLDG